MRPGVVGGCTLAVRPGFLRPGLDGGPVEERGPRETTKAMACSDTAVALARAAVRAAIWVRCESGGEEAARTAAAAGKGSQETVSRSCSAKKSRRMRMVSLRSLRE